MFAPKMSSLTLNKLSCTSIDEYVSYGRENVMWNRRIGLGAPASSKYNGVNCQEGSFPEITEGFQD